MGAVWDNVLLHVCCAPCATAAVERLRQTSRVSLFFSNSNIWPEEEYRRRHAWVVELSGHLSAPLIEDVYDHAAWLDFVRGFEDEAERGRRCQHCFMFNLRRAAAYAVANGFDGFTTTLTISPHKDTSTIFAVGRQLGPFLELDFKKRDGFRRSLELARQLGLYRQDYCGCEFSLAARDRRLAGADGRE